MANAQLALLVEPTAIPENLLASAWYLHGIASSPGAQERYGVDRRRCSTSASTPRSASARRRLLALSEPLFERAASCDPTSRSPAQNWREEGLFVALVLISTHLGERYHLG